ncbi:unnamed protein product [Albugo candida]|uniref:Integrase catalytic domain-containing protein n=1 Tax=Albugo candida TaxID=65357 RepID=A0A024FWC3_9STRA|nr:unnamed protein product [Albugo candida]|eukprot:CCI11341.1 unnamed protein product [Albugo candida]
MRDDSRRQAEELCHFAQLMDSETISDAPREPKKFSRDRIGAIREFKPKKRMNYYNCGKSGHMKKDCRNQSSSSSKDIVLGIGCKNNTLEQAKKVWILDSGSSRHLVTDENMLQNRKECTESCILPNGKEMKLGWTGSAKIIATVNGLPRNVLLNDVQNSEHLPWNIVSYGKSEAKGCKLAYREDGSRVVRHTADGAIVFEVNMVKNVLVIETEGRERVSSVMDILASIESVDDANKQTGSLLHFHQQFGHLNYDNIERIAKLPESGIEIDDHRRLKCLTCAESKQTKNRQSRKDTGINSPTERIGGVICSDLKGPITPQDRRGNRYLVNFIDYKSNYCRVFLAKTKNEAATKFQDFLTYFEKQFDCKIHVLRTDGGAEYKNVDIFCKKKGVRRQISEAENQASNGKAKRMHRTVMNLVRSMIFGNSMALYFWGDAAEYATYILNRSPTRANKGRRSPLKVLTGKNTSLADVVTFGSPCSVRIRTGKKSLAKRSEEGIVIGKCDETKGYKVFLPKSKTVIITQHISNVESTMEGANRFGNSKGR